ncbi:trehalase-like isoform X2 [Sipha flava]|nr:trehalase-like isoform X2 [Sipha flava]
MYSTIWVPNGFIMPGGRFGELYYWDTYWIIKGLLLCDMKETAKGIINNIVYLVDKFGFMPNGGRIYYVNRSQPPMLIQMASSYYKFTNDLNYISSVITTLENEFQFWMDNRMITFEKNGKSYTMARYYGVSRGPRPESYREDYKVAENYDTEEKKNEFYVRIKSAAETGWDFSSRWFITANGSDHGTLSDVHTPNIVPVDLNSILHSNALILSSWFRLLNDYDKANKYNLIAENLVIGIQEVMWRADKGCWCDWDLINNKHRESFYMSNIVPLWTGSHKIPNDSVAYSVLKYLRDQNVINSNFSVNYNGMPASMYKSSEQWDFPNGWPPLQAFLIQGLYNTQHKLARQVAADLAKAWINSNHKSFSNGGIMYEKYNVTVVGGSGGGGEYAPQTGFGWTNGVALELLNQWDDFVADSSSGPPPKNSSTRRRRESYAKELNKKISL